MCCLKIQNVVHKSVIIFLFARVSLQEYERTPLQLNIRYAFSPEVADLDIFRVRGQNMSFFVDIRESIVTLNRALHRESIS